MKRNHPFFTLALKYKDLNINLLRDAAGFLRITLKSSVSDPFHFDADPDPDPDPRIRIRDNGSGSGL